MILEGSKATINDIKKESYLGKSSVPSLLKRIDSRIQ